MNYEYKVNRLIQKHRDGVYTILELLPLIVLSISQQDAAQLFTYLPPDIKKAFIEFVEGYPMDGGLRIRDSKALPKDVMLSLKSAATDLSCCNE